MALTATAPPDLALELEGILHDPEVFEGSVPKSVSEGKSSAGTSLQIVPLG